VGNEVFPENPRNRRALVVIEQSVWKRLDDEPEARALLRSPEVTVLPSNLSARMLGVRVLGGDLNPNRVYLQNPFRPEHYVEAADAEGAFALDRQHHYLQLCQHLGAMEVEVLHVERLRTSQEESAAFGESKHGVGAKMTASQGIDQELQRSLQTKATFATPATDIAAASRMLSEYRLEGDAEFSHLIELRSAPNPLTAIETEYSVTSSSRSVLKLGVALKFPAVLKVDVGYQSSMRNETSIRVKTRTLFSR
jgi:hypothetical protein